jgi:hypothetical protein
MSVEGSEDGSVLEEEYTTALPAYSSKDKERKEKERKERGFRGVLPFPRKRKDKDKDKDKDKEKEKDKDKDKGKHRDRSSERHGRERSGSALGEYSHLGSFRGKSSRNDRNDRNGKEERDEEFWLHGWFTGSIPGSDRSTQAMSRQEIKRRKSAGELLTKGSGWTQLRWMWTAPTQAVFERIVSHSTNLATRTLLAPSTFPRCTGGFLLRIPTFAYIHHA